MSDEGPSLRAEPEKPFSVGILFVHGMGEQERGDTISQMGDAATDWLRRWLEGRSPKGDLKIVEARLRTGHEAPPGTADHAVGGAAHASVSIRYANDGECDPAPGAQAWLLKESWWANAFRPATFMELVGWVVAVGPWVIASQRASIRRRMQGSPAAGQVPLVGWVVGLLLTLLAAVVAAVITPLSVTLLVLSMIPIPIVSDIMRTLVRNLAGSFGDLLVLVRSPIRFAAMAEQVRQDIADMDRDCTRVVVVAHSQGSAVAWHAIRRQAERVPSGDASPASVGTFISFGQAFRKLKALHRLHESGGEQQGPFTVLATVSTLLLIVAFWAGLGVVGDVIGAEGDVGTSMARVDWGWLVLGVALALVVVIQFVLERRAADHERLVEDDVVREITCVRQKFPGFRWLDLWASADPAPNGPLLAEEHPELAAYVDSYKVRNAASTLLDHSIYWSNATEFASAIVFHAASLAPPSAIGVREPIPPVLVEAARLRDGRVSLLAAARVALVAALAVALYGLREELPAIGGWMLSLLNAIPLLPDWFGDWHAIAQGAVGAFLLGLIALVASGVLAWGWSGVIRDDERAFFASKPQNTWTSWAIAWSLAAALLPILAIGAVSIALGSIGVVVSYFVLVAIGLLAVLVVLSGGGRRLGDAARGG